MRFNNSCTLYRPSKAIQADNGCAQPQTVLVITKVLQPKYLIGVLPTNSVNLNKTCYTIFKTKKKKMPEFLNNVKINNVNIARVKSAKYLHVGVTLDENLNWEEHVRETNKAIIKTANAFKIVSTKFLKQPNLYYTMHTFTPKFNMGLKFMGKHQLQPSKRYKHNKIEL